MTAMGTAMGTAIGTAMGTAIQVYSRGICAAVKSKV